MDIEKIYSLLPKPINICIDSRKAKTNDVFVALKGDNTDGNRFAQKAIENGASIAIIDNQDYLLDNRTILVNDVLKTLQELAKYHRKQLTIPIIGITGSNGKTTSKEVMNAVLNRQYKTYATLGNLNNHIGVPMSVLAIDDSYEMAIIEMGANHQKEIEFLCTISKPNYGVVTNIGKAHLEGFGGYEGVIKGKSELYDYINSSNGKVFVNMDDELLMKLTKNLERVTYGRDQNANYTGNISPSGAYIKVSLNKKLEMQSNLSGEYNFSNIMLAYAVGKYFNICDEKIKEGIESYYPENNRSQLIENANNTLICDAYNANPSSMQVAIDNLIAKGENTFFVLGEMLELGEESEKEHQLLVNLLLDKKLNGVLIGEEFKKVKCEFPIYNNAQNFAEEISKYDFMNKKILLKGSRKNKLETLIPYFSSL